MPNSPRFEMRSSVPHSASHSVAGDFCSRRNSPLPFSRGASPRPSSSISASSCVKSETQGRELPAGRLSSAASRSPSCRRRPSSTSLSATMKPSAVRSASSTAAASEIASSEPLAVLPLISAAVPLSSVSLSCASVSSLRSSVSSFCSSVLPSLLVCFLLLCVFPSSGHAHLLQLSRDAHALPLIRTLSSNLLQSRLAFPDQTLFPYSSLSLPASPASSALALPTSSVSSGPAGSPSSHTSETTPLHALAAALPPSRLSSPLQANSGKDARNAVTSPGRQCGDSLAGSLPPVADARLHSRRDEETEGVAPSNLHASLLAPTAASASNPDGFSQRDGDLQWLFSLRGGAGGLGPSFSRRLPAFRRRQALSKVGDRVSTANARFVRRPLSRLASFCLGVPAVTRFYCAASVLLTLLSSPTLASFVCTKTPGILGRPRDSSQTQPGRTPQSPLAFPPPQGAEPEGLLAPEQLAMHAPRVLRAFEFWRPFTAGTFFGAPSLGTALRIYGAYTSLRHLEETAALAPGALGSIRALDGSRAATKPLRRGLGAAARGDWSASSRGSFLLKKSENAGESATARGLAEASSDALAAARSAETLKFLLFQFATLSLIAGSLKLPFFASSLSSAALYQACRSNPEASVSLIMGIRLPHKFLPYGLAAVDVLHAQDLRAAVPGLLGVCSGELYWFLTQTLPLRLGGPRLLETPRAFQRFFMRLKKSTSEKNSGK
ncbi:Der1-like family protein [Toxoplasma gondii RUB]|uniref:Der1-like family protein n=1 Tax=Toxoplasma gondii RUB TaxID=935652 RepID=A0A086M0C0_TOXGO|nr:Der1-like family protein [Toxoplasma gondii RUB]